MTGSQKSSCSISRGSNPARISRKRRKTFCASPSRSRALPPMWTMLFSRPFEDNSLPASSSSYPRRFAGRIFRRETTARSASSRRGSPKANSARCRSAKPRQPASCEVPPIRIDPRLLPGLASGKSKSHGRSRREEILLHHEGKPLLLVGSLPDSTLPRPGGDLPSASEQICVRRSLCHDGPGLHREPGTQPKFPLHHHGAIFPACSGAPGASGRRHLERQSIFTLAGRVHRRLWRIYARAALRFLNVVPL